MELFQIYFTHFVFLIELACFTIFVMCCLTEQYFVFFIFPPSSLLSLARFGLLCAASHLMDLHPLPTLPVQPLLQGWEQPPRTVSHQFCACRLLQTSSAARAHCTAWSFPEFCICWWKRQAVQCHAARSSLLFSLVSSFLCPVLFFSILYPFVFFCLSVSSSQLLISGVLRYLKSPTIMNWSQI